MELDQTKVQEEFDRAPEHIQEFILSDEMNDVFESIVKDYKLHLDDAEQLSYAINSIILSITKLDTFPGLLKKALPNTPEEDRTAITKRVNEQIFEKLKDQARSGSLAEKTNHKVEEEGVTLPKPETVQETEQSVEADSSVPQSGAMDDAKKRLERELPATTEPQTVESKLIEPVKEVSEEVVVSQETKSETQADSYKGGADPYREPID